MNNKFNVPLILKVMDSFGNVLYRNQGSDDEIRENFSHDPKFDLNVGDILTIEIEVDPSFKEDEYSIRWGTLNDFSKPQPKGKKAIIHITEKEVAQEFTVHCHIISNKTWHRLNVGADDRMYLTYRVLPPEQ